MPDLDLIKQAKQGAIRRSHNRFSPLSQKSAYVLPVFSSCPRKRASRATDAVPEVPAPSPEGIRGLRGARRIENRDHPSASHH
jgi:hypothetical protein